jgi:hypothetical protein
MEPAGLLPYSEQPATSILSYLNPINTLYTTYLDSF